MHYERLKKDYINSQMVPKMKKIEELRAIIQDKERGGRVFAIKQEFQNKHPQISLQALEDFYINDLSKRKQDELANMEPMEGLTRLLEFFMKENNIEKPSLPQKYNSVYADESMSLNDVRNHDLPMNRY
ncbi:hypothetical protein LNU06_01630 [Campylobacter sp. VicNov18]|uniref:hypothetical protein n=1 Tax=Campylobacter bilis TaxID=2691918 RepID=UPI00130E3C7D|nr:hypothetical protein [Campylobacter bilis]MPV63365.1 hypothetical protein [Campylobacter hepaticus]MBM0636864.1 hypothetical protein [Campylobacter bilis]MCC8277570.1 hypothetical protein [Campylobacter bilis]MCC8299179.1 hypothetical protein [Campylobacter bilis]MCC8300479.1 hypothetical protein [Campylobacter bilis]